MLTFSVVSLAAAAILGVLSGILMRWHRRLWPLIAVSSLTIFGCLILAAQGYVPPWCPVGAFLAFGFGVCAEPMVFGMSSLIPRWRRGLLLFGGVLLLGVIVLTLLGGRVFVSPEGQLLGDYPRTIARSWIFALGALVLSQVALVGYLKWCGLKLRDGILPRSLLMGSLLCIVGSPRALLSLVERMEKVAPAAMILLTLGLAGELLAIFGALLLIAIAGWILGDLNS